MSGRDSIRYCYLGSSYWLDRGLGRLLVEGGVKRRQVLGFNVVRHKGDATMLVLPALQVRCRCRCRSGQGDQCPREFACVLVGQQLGQANESIGWCAVTRVCCRGTQARVESDGWRPDLIVGYMGKRSNAADALLRLGRQCMHKRERKVFASCTA